MAGRHGDTDAGQEASLRSADSTSVLLCAARLLTVWHVRCTLICSLQGNYHSPTGCLSVYKPGRSQSHCTHLRSFFHVMLRRAIRVKMSQDIYSNLMSATPCSQPLQHPGGGSWYV